MRRTRPSSKPQIGGPDFGSVMALTVFVLGSTLWASYAPLPPSKAEEMRSASDPAEHVFTGSTLVETPHDTQTRCAGSVDTVIRTQACSRAERTAWLWAASNAARGAMGERPCWWYAQKEDLAAISGITEAWAERILEARGPDGVHDLRLPGELAEQIGVHRAKVLQAHVTIDCALKPRPMVAP